MAAPSRSSKRRHSAQSSHLLDDDEALLLKAMTPLSSTEKAEWPGWIELESEPSFFTIMMKELGVKGVKAEELFGLDDDFISNLPKPIYGLVFLFEHTGEQASLDTGPEDCDFWFANQTTPNACATVALLNILMNQEQIDIGSQLRSLRDDTKACIPPHRGFHIGKSVYIRSIHNKFARRMDQLLADACLQDEAKKNSTTPKRRKTPRLGMRRKSRSEMSQDETAFHFVAYVPVGATVYELDGLRPRPVRVGKYEELESWTSIAAPHIQARMFQYESNQTSFSLMALCNDDSAQNYENQLRHAVGRLSEIDRAYRVKYPEKAGDAVSAFFKHPEVETIAAEQAADTGEHHPDLSDQRLQLLSAAESALRKYQDHRAAARSDESCVQQRQRDYGLAIHTWLLLLSSNGVLESLADTE